MSATSRKAKGVFQSHDSARSERSWEIEIPMRKVIERSADRGTWTEGGNMRLNSCSPINVLMEASYNIPFAIPDANFHKYKSGFAPEKTP